MSRRLADIVKLVKLRKASFLGPAAFGTMLVLWAVVFGPNWFRSPSKAGFYVTDANWDQGVARRWAGYYVDARSTGHEPGMAVKLKNGETRQIVRTSEERRLPERLRVGTAARPEGPRDPPGVFRGGCVRGGRNRLLLPDRCQLEPGGSSTLGRLLRSSRNARLRCRAPDQVEERGIPHDHSSRRVREVPQCLPRRETSRSHRPWNSA